MPYKAFETEADWKKEVDKAVAAAVKDYVPLANVEALKKAHAEAIKKEKDAAQEAIKKAAAAEGKALRYEVAAKRGIPLDLASRLVGETKDELEKDAELLSGYVSSVRSSAPPKSTAGGGAETGGTGNDEAWGSLLSALTE